MTSTRYRRQKWHLVLGILGTGLLVAILWSAWQALAQGKGYPESYLFGPPQIRFNDFTNNSLAATLPVPYDEPFVSYPPATYLTLKVLTYSDTRNLVVIYFFSLTALALLLAKVLRPVVTGPWKRVFLAYLFLAISYPVLFCLDRGNVEIVLVPLIGWPLYFYSKHRDIEGTVCLVPAICLKLYPALLLVLLLRRRKTGLAVAGAMGSLVVFASGFWLFQASPGYVWNAYRQNLDFYQDYYVLGASSLDASASPWNAYLIVLVTQLDFMAVKGVHLGFDAPLMLVSYRVYAACLMLLALLCTAYAWFYESKLERGMIMLLLFLSIAAPNGADYRLIYTSMALIILVLLPRRRRGDWIVLVLLALAVIPKKEVLLTYLGPTETGYADVPYQTFLNPILILFAMALLFYQSRCSLDWNRTMMRLADLLPWQWRWR